MFPIFTVEHVSNIHNRTRCQFDFNALVNTACQLIFFHSWCGLTFYRRWPFSLDEWQLLLYCCCWEEGRGRLTPPPPSIPGGLWGNICQLTNPEVWIGSTYFWRIDLIFQSREISGERKSMNYFLSLNICKDFFTPQLRFLYYLTGWLCW